MKYNRFYRQSLYIPHLFLSIFLIIIIHSGEGQAQMYKPLEVNGKWGFVNDVNEWVIDTLFVMAMSFNENGIAPVVDDSGWVYIDTCGQKLFRPFIYDNGPDYFSEGLSRYVKNNKIGYINARGKVQIEVRFDFARPFSEGMAAFCSGCTTIQHGEHKKLVMGKWGYINKKGDIVIEPHYDEAHNFQNGTASVLINGEEIIIDPQGNRIE